MHKDRLVRFGYELVEKTCQLHGTAIEVIDNTAKTEEQEVVEDLVQIITVFSCKLQGKRSKKTKQIIKELTSDDIGEESQTDSNA
jgi:predicted site-specific integrase-resolvase